MDLHSAEARPVLSPLVRTRHVGGVNVVVWLVSERFLVAHTVEFVPLRTRD